ALGGGAIGVGEHVFDHRRVVGTAGLGECCARAAHAAAGGSGGSGQPDGVGLGVGGRGGNVADHVHGDRRVFGQVVDVGRGVLAGLVAGRGAAFDEGGQAGGGEGAAAVGGA